MRDVLIICPSERDLEAVAAASLGDRYRVRTIGADVDALDDFDPAAVVAEAEAVESFDGVVGTKDRTALLAAIVAAGRGLPGPTPASVLRCQHKPTSRALQAAVAPGAVPHFVPLLDGRLPLPPPFFLKPVVGRLSQGARGPIVASLTARIFRGAGFATRKHCASQSRRDG